VLLLHTPAILGQPRATYQWIMLPKLVCLAVFSLQGEEFKEREI
jgi:hypothetical protein